MGFGHLDAQAFLVANRCDERRRHLRAYSEGQSFAPEPAEIAGARITVALEEGKGA